MWEFHLKAFEIFKQNTFSLLLIKIGSNRGWDLAHDILMHLLSLNWKLFLLDNSASSSTAVWMLIISPFSTGLAVVMSSTYFHRSVFVTLISSIIRYKSYSGSSFILVEHQPLHFNIYNCLKSLLFVCGISKVDNAAEDLIIRSNRTSFGVKKVRSIY